MPESQNYERVIVLTTLPFTQHRSLWHNRDYQLLGPDCVMVSIKPSHF